MFLPKEPPHNPKENATYLAYGVALQAAGLGISAGSIWLIADSYEAENPDVYFSGIGFGIGLFGVGTALLANSIKNMATVRKSYRDLKKEQKIKKVSINIEPVPYGIGIVCRF